MANESKKAGVPATDQVVALVPSARTIEALVHQLAKSTENISWSDHALERMEERDISDVVAVEVLRRGTSEGAIEQGKNVGEWKIKMTMPVKGRREVGVVVLTVRNARLYVKTVEWEDLR
jgi:hypothetical protein